jgi:phospholipid/cholesterol/gamma-HCH transport system permease protein
VGVCGAVINAPVAFAAEWKGAINSVSIMPHTDPELQVTPDGRGTLCLAGRLDAAVAARWWRSIETMFRRGSVSELSVEASELSYCDGAGIALIQGLRSGWLTGGRAATISGLREDLAARLDSFTEADYRQFRPQPHRDTGLFEEVGNNVAVFAADLREQATFLGAIVAAFGSVIVRPKLLRWAEVKRVALLAGVNALPIVSLMSLLIGFIIAFESASAFAMFGAQIFMTNMLGIVLTRELGPLLTAVMVTGRSGSAFAAELGTMKVNEELNALVTMGLDPVRFLVVQRILAGMIVTPLLTIYSVVLGLGGGTIVMMSLGYPLQTVMVQLRGSVTLGDLFLAVSKGLVFGAIVATVGCLRGLQTARGPAAVGASTTRAVVAGILLVIIADAVFSVVLYAMK